MEEETTSTQESTPITLTISPDVAIAIGVATIHYRAWLAGSMEEARTIPALDLVYHLIMQQSLPAITKAMLRDMRWHVAGLKDEPEGGSQHVTTHLSQG